MPVKFASFVARRYLRAKRKQAFIGVISIITLVGITLGVAALNISLAVHNGMRHAFLQSLVGDTGQLFITTRSAENRDFTRQEQSKILNLVKEMPSVAAVSLQRQEYCLLTSTEKRSVPAQIKGVIPDDDLLASGHLQQLVAGDARGLNQGLSGEVGPHHRPGIVLGYDLAAKLGLRPGDPVRVTFPRLSSPSLTLSQVRLKQRQFEVVGIFRTGSSELDGFHAYVHLEVLFEMFQTTTVHSIQVRLKSLTQLDRAKADLRTNPHLPDTARVLDLRDLNQGLLHALTLEKWGSTLIISLIIMIAALNMVSALIMLVMEKHRDIGILKALGASRRMLMSIFVRQGLYLSWVGTLLGTLLGVTLSLWADSTQILKLDREVYEVLNYLPFEVHAMEVLGVALGSIAISLLSTLYPSYQAASLDPVEALRYE